MTIKDKTDDRTENEEAKFTGVDPESLADDLKPIYKSLQADYTRKTQEVAQQRKDFEANETKWKDQLKEYGAVEQEVKQWRDWYASLEEEVGDEGGQSGDGLELKSAGQGSGGVADIDEGGQSAPDARILTTINVLNSKIAELEGQLGGMNETLRKSRDQTNRMFVYNDQLNKLEGSYGKIDRKMILDHALKTGHTDLEKAYKDLYQDDLIQAEVDKRVQEELKKERTSTAVKSGQQVIFRPKEGRPKNWEEATAAALKEIGSV